MENQTACQYGFECIGKDQRLDMDIFYERITGNLYAQKAKDLYIRLDKLIKAKENKEAH